MRAGWSRETEPAGNAEGPGAVWRTESMLRLARLETEIPLWSLTEFHPARGDSSAWLRHLLVGGAGDTLSLVCRFGADSLRVTKRSSQGAVRYARAVTADLWTPEEISLRTRQSGIAPGTEFRFDSFIPEMDAVLPMILRVEKPDTLRLADRVLPVFLWKSRSPLLPALESLEWRDREGRLWRSEVPSMGLTSTRTSRAEALVSAPGAEVLAGSFLHLDRRLATGRRYERILYEARTPEGSPPMRPPETPMARLVAVDGTVSRIEARRLRPPAPRSPAGAALFGPKLSEEERRRALQSTLLMELNHPEVREAAGLAVAGETDPWKRALSLQRFVTDRIQDKNLRVLFASAAQTLSSGEGDCTEHAVLLAALARASGLPSRVVAGLVVLDDQMGYHLWTEVDAGFGWIGLDAALDRAPVDGRYLPLVVSDLAEDSIAPLTLGVLQTLGRVEVRILEAEGSDEE